MVRAMIDVVHVTIRMMTGLVHVLSTVAARLMIAIVHVISALSLIVTTIAVRETMTPVHTLIPLHRRTETFARRLLMNDPAHNREDGAVRGVGIRKTTELLQKGELEK